MPSTLAKHVYLIGFMGAGKTSVARCLSQEEGLPALDLDEVIAQTAGCSIPEVFGQSGEEGFRCLESACLERLLDEAPCLIACGGGVVARPENVAVMKRSGFIVYLEVSAEEALARVGGDAARPLLANPEAADELYRSRLHLYEEAADATVATTALDVASIAGKVREILVAQGVLS